MLRISLIFIYLIVQSLALDNVDVLQKLTRDFNRNFQLKKTNNAAVLTDIAYAPYKINSIGEDSASVLLVPTNCEKSEEDKKINLKNCGFNRDYYFYNIIAEKKETDYEIKDAQIFTNSKEILNIQDFDVLGFDSFENGTLTAFYTFMKQHKRDYSVEEFNHRFAIFRRNSKMIKLISLFDPTARYGHTQFADLTYEEFSQRHLGYKKGDSKVSVLHKSNLDDKDLPEEFDWREHGAVTEVKNQESCGSCWAFSVVGNIEGRYYLAKNKLYSLSEQELVDCDTQDEGCNGGYPINAYQAISQIGGLTTEDSYPYLGEKEDSCKLKKETIKVQVSKGLQISTDENEIAKELYLNGPVSMALNAFFLQFYFGDVSHPPKALCDPEGLDHAVLGVGFGLHTTSILHRHQPYWLIKNSWGKTWGENGYFRIYRGDGTCGINEMVTTGVIA